MKIIMNNQKIKTNGDLSKEIMNKLLKSKDLLSKLNILITKMKNKYLLTYIIEKVIEQVDTISSNQIENIHTTVDESANDEIENNVSSPYIRYRGALKQAHNKLTASNIIRSNDITSINNYIRGKKIGFRKTPVHIEEKPIKKIIHYGADAQNIPSLITDLIEWINTDDKNIDPIIKSFLIHHQFEYIHPFTDGNGRTGRILLAILFTKYKILEVPTSIFSYSIIKKKSKYYEALRAADKKDYEKYLEIMLDIFNHSLEISITFTNDFNDKYSKIKELINEKNLSKKISDLLPYCFAGVKVTMKYLEKKSKLNNKTIVKYLNFLENLNIMKQEIKGRYRPYKNLIIESLIGKYI